MPEPVVLRALVAVLATCIAPVAAAQADPARVEEGRRHFARADALFQRGEYLEASREYTDAWTRLPASDPMRARARRGIHLSQCMDLAADGIDAAAMPECREFRDELPRRGR